MKKINLLQISSVIILSLFIGIAFVYADWTPPVSTPPICIVGNPGCDAPINTGSGVQYKAGSLGIGGAFRAYSNAIFDGNVGIGVASPSEKLDVTGNIKASGTICDVNGCIGGGGGGSAGNMKLFQASGTWTKPSGVNTVYVQVAGGGGGGGSYQGGVGSGGGGGGYVEGIIDVSSISSVPVTVGTGGAGSAVWNISGGNGGSSSFGSFVVATGGAGGRSYNYPGIGGSFSGPNAFNGSNGGSGAGGRYYDYFNGRWVNNGNSSGGPSGSGISGGSGGVVGGNRIGGNGSRGSGGGGSVGPDTGGNGGSGFVMVREY
ncbi:MAG: glycine-rich domain-containing protein [Patescibacteria group bacterium]